MNYAFGHPCVDIARIHAFGHMISIGDVTHNADYSSNAAQGFASWRCAAGKDFPGSALVATTTYLAIRALRRAGIDELAEELKMIPQSASVRNPQLQLSAEWEALNRDNQSPLEKMKKVRALSLDPGLAKLSKFDDMASGCFTEALYSLRDGNQDMSNHGQDVLEYGEWLSRFLRQKVSNPPTNYSSVEVNSSQMLFENSLGLLAELHFRMKNPDMAKAISLEYISLFPHGGHRSLVEYIVKKTEVGAADFPSGQNGAIFKLQLIVVIFSLGSFVFLVIIILHFRSRQAIKKN